MDIRVGEGCTSMNVGGSSQDCIRCTIKCPNQRILQSLRREGNRIDTASKLDQGNVKINGTNSLYKVLPGPKRKCPQAKFRYPCDERQAEEKPGAGTHAHVREPGRAMFGCDYFLCTLDSTLPHFYQAFGPGLSAFRQQASTRNFYKKIWNQGYRSPADLSV